MWCFNCEQNVPGIASLAEGEEIVCCARCGEALHGDSQRSKEEATDSTTSDTTMPAPEFEPPDWGEWELDEKLYDVDRLLGELNALDAPRATSSAAPWHVPAYEAAASDASLLPAGSKNATANPRARRRSSWLAWSVLGLGIMTFVCGSVLLGWSFFTDHSTLWRIGMPLSLVGQAGLLIGVILQLEGLWQNDHDATETLEDLDEQITELRHAAAMLNASHSRPGQSFYLHMAEGASPHLMLADLKSQLDLLAVQMEKHRR